MAIFPLYSTTIINKDVLTASPFKAGMAIIMDPNGRAIKADSQLLISTSIQEKYARFLGFAASDHDISGNTLIVPDVVGSNYLDANNRFINNQNLEYSVPKRALLDLQDTAVSNFYNASDPNIISRRGIGVYNTTTDYFITDQFVPVLHGDYGFDSTTIASINPGDLLTFGGGVNAGKLVKVNSDSFGPDVLVVAIVEKYIPSTGLLHFRQVNYGLSFGTNPYILAIDAGNPVSYVSGSTSTTNLVNGTSGGTLVNGTSFSSANSGSWVFDGADDYINNTFTGTFTNSATVLIWLQPNHPVQSMDTPSLLLYTGLMTFTNSILVSHYPWPGESAYISILRTNRVGPIALSPSVDRAIPHLLVITTDGTSWKMYQNNILINTTAAEPTVSLNHTIIGNGGYSNTQYWYQGKVFQFNLLNQALTQTQITNYYNTTRGRYGV
jgi:hypothetical protein